MLMSMLYAHVHVYADVYMSMLHVQINAACSSPCRTDMDIQHRHGYAAWTWACTIACTWACSIEMKEASLLFTHTYSFYTLRSNTVWYDTIYRTVQYHIPYGTIPYTIWYSSLLFQWYFSLLFPHSFLYSDVLALSCQLSLSGIYTWREIHNNPLPPWDNNQTNNHFPPLGGHSTSCQQRAPALLLQQHPTPLYPPAYWHNKCLST
jgi:hypothetical protein